MRLSQLQYFMAVYEQQSITKAAETLHVSQPSISVALKELESEYHVNLFRRVNKKMYLTSEGQIFHKYAQAILKNVNDLEDNMLDLSHNRNMIKIGVPLQIGTFLLPLLCIDFKKAHPNIGLNLMECGAMDIVNKLLDEELDMAVACIDVQSSLLELHPLFDTQICFCVHKSHPLAGRKSISFEESCQYTSVMVPEGSFTYKRIFEIARVKNVRPDVMLFSQQLHTILNLVNLAGAGTYLIRESIMNAPDIVAIPFDEPINITANTITKRGRLVYTDSKTLISFIRQRYARQG